MKGYRTIIINLVPMVLLMTDYLVGNNALINTVFHKPETAIMAVGVINLINIALRFITNTAIGKKE